MQTNNRFSTYLRDLGAELRGFPPALWVLTGGQFINRFGSFVFPFLALFLSQRGFTPAHVALVLGAIAAGQMLSPFVGGYLADAIGRRNTITIALTGGALTILSLYYCETLGWLVLMSGLHGFVSQMFSPAANALLSDVVPEEQRVTAYAIFRLALNAGYAAGPAMAGLLYTRAPALIFWGDALTTLIFAAGAFWLLPHGLRTVEGRVSSPAVAWASWREASVDLVQNRPFLQLLIAKLLMAISFAQAFNVLAIDTDSRGIVPFEYGLIMGFNGALIMAVELPLVRWIKRYPARRVLTIGFTMIGLGCASFPWAETLMGFFVAMAIYTLGEMISLPISAAYAAKLAPPQFRGRYFGYLGLAWGAASLAASAGVWAYSLLGASWWIWSGVFGLVAGGLMTMTWSDRRLN